MIKKVFVGGMKSGKSEKMLFYINRYHLANKKIICFYPEIDIKNEGIKSRATDKTYNAYPVKTVEDITIRLELYPSDVIFIDEIQFLSTEIINYLDSLSLPVYCSGLDLDYKKEMFQPTALAMALSDEVEKIYSVCSICNSLEGKYSHCNHKPLDGSFILIGEDEFIPVCRTCYNILN